MLVHTIAMKLEAAGGGEGLLPNGALLAFLGHLSPKMLFIRLWLVV